MRPSEPHIRLCEVSLVPFEPFADWGSATTQSGKTAATIRLKATISPEKLWREDVLLSPYDPWESMGTDYTQQMKRKVTRMKPTTSLGTGSTKTPNAQVIKLEKEQPQDDLQLQREDKQVHYPW